MSEQAGPPQENWATEIALRFSYHKPKGDQPQKYTDLRAYAHTFAMMIAEMVPDCREKSLAITKLEEVVMWANAGIARRG